MYSGINFFSENCSFRLKEKKMITAWLTKIIQKSSNKTGNITYIFCDDAYLADLNQKYLNHKTLTDIITFDYVEGNMINGDIFISIERVQENAIKYKTPFKNELLRVICHGVLHLMGFADKNNSEKLVMRAKEQECLNLFFKK
ncbi:MAG TPA: rRNA maturation RNase YbeY [Bacteroidales bacterium]|nr:rRNA maturation RNase YbeY [Bacteroidales bacterium]HQH18007.1 rRNA maturation RNase YbeY [Bacteroidales bacterium]HQI44723.1 rRNA maturation RNase YbeY [Bacteroidales bacterium]